MALFSEELDTLAGVLRLGRATRRTIHLNIAASVLTKASCDLLVQRHPSLLIAADSSELGLAAELCDGKTKAGLLSLQHKRHTWLELLKISKPGLAAAEPAVQAAYLPGTTPGRMPGIFEGMHCDRRRWRCWCWLRWAGSRCGGLCWSTWARRWPSSPTRCCCCASGCGPAAVVMAAAPTETTSTAMVMATATSTDTAARHDAVLTAAAMAWAVA